MAECADPGSLISCTVSNIAGSEAEKWAKEMMAGANDLWNGFFTSWITSDLDGVIGGSTADWFEGIAMPIQVFLLTLGLMVAGIRIMITARGDAAADAGKRFIRAVFVSVAGVAFFTALQAGANALTKSILDSALNGEPPSVLWEEKTFEGNVVMWILFGFLGVIATGLQWGIMILRAIAISVLLPFWPIAAAGAMFEDHEGMFQKVTRWLLAWLLYSPVAAALYGLSIKFRSGVDGMQGAMVGMAIFALALFALPAMMRLVMPLSSALGRASAGAMAFGAAKTAVVAGVAVGSAVATAGASAPASAAAASTPAATSGAATSGAATTGSATSGATGGAGATGATSTGTQGATGATGSQGAAGPSGSSGSSGGGSGSGNSGSGSGGRAGWDMARELGHALPSGNRGVGDMIDE